MLDLDPAAVSLTLRGLRKMTPHEAHQIATILGVPVTEVLRQAGIEVTDDVRRVPLQAYMDSEGTVVDLPGGTHEHVMAPADCPIGTYAVQVRSPNTIKDGWLLFIGPDRIASNLNVDRLCICATSSGEQVLGVVRRGYRSSTFNLVLWPTMKMLVDKETVWSSAVLWIKPNS